jgi:hypothetical protein
VMRWLKKDTSYIAQINELLGMEEHVPAEQRTRENTGTCAVCFRNIKLVQKGKDKLMALHGYNRPGHGTIVGRCWGGEYPPYELSCEATKHILKHVEGRLLTEEAYLKSLSSPKLTEFNERKWSMGGEPRIITKAEADKISEGQWQYRLDEHIKTTEREVAHTKAERNIFKWLVEKWVVRELPHEGDKQPDWWTNAARAVGTTG